MLTTQLPGLYILEDDIKGRGVYTANDINEGSIIEICPVIVLSQSDKKLVHQTKLHDYYFLWDEQMHTIALPLGYGCLYNHDESANADTEQDFSEKVIRIIAKRQIKSGEEITINYLGGVGGSETGLWF